MKFIISKPTPEYSDILHNPTYFPRPFCIGLDRVALYMSELTKQGRFLMLKVRGGRLVVCYVISENCKHKCMYNKTSMQSIVSCILQ
jgi:hypothetical protein